MTYTFLADMVLVTHLLFILFVIFGGIAVLGNRWVAFAHLPAAIWAILLEFFGWRCPLTPLEQWLRVCSGRGSYENGFIEHYLMQLIYPQALTRNLQIIFGCLVLIINSLLYIYILWKRNKS